MMQSGEACVGVKTQSLGLGMFGSGASLRHLASRYRGALGAAEGLAGGY